MSCRYRSRTGYTKHGCRCAACTAANAEYQRAWMRSQRRPDPTPERLLDATACRTVLAELAAAGWSRRLLAQCTGIARSTLDKLAAGTTRRVRPTTAAALTAAHALLLAPATVPDELTEDHPVATPALEPLEPVVLAALDEFAAEVLAGVLAQPTVG